MDSPPSAPGPFRILWQDDCLVVVHKPQGIHVHPTAMSPREPAMLQALRDQVGTFVYPAHRLDRPTSGIVVFALDAATAGIVQADFREDRVRKTYHALVRGWLHGHHTIDRPLADEGTGALRPSLTVVRPELWFSVPLPLGNFPSTRLSLVRLEPRTGRFHQLRRHLAGIGHPIVYDTGHGDRHINHWADRHFAVRELQLFATAITFPHPHSRGELTILDPLTSPEDRLLILLRQWECTLNSV